MEFVEASTSTENIMLNIKHLRSCTRGVLLTKQAQIVGCATSFGLYTDVLCSITCKIKYSWNGCEVKFLSKIFRANIFEIIHDSFNESLAKAT